jgi:hypothetical protein
MPVTCCRPHVMKLWCSCVDYFLCRCMNIAAWQRLCSVRTPWSGHTSIPVLPNVAARRQAVTMFLHSTCQRNLYIEAVCCEHDQDWYERCCWYGTGERVDWKFTVHKPWMYHSFLFSHGRMCCDCEGNQILRFWQTDMFEALLVVKCGFWNGICCLSVWMDLCCVDTWTVRHAVFLFETYSA